MSEKPNTDQHVYVQVANILRNQILFRELSGQIPSIRTLSQLYSINFKTANRAVTLLVEEGLCYRIIGKGTFVVDTDSGIKEFSLIGLILSDIINPNFARLAQAIQEQAHHKNMAILVNTSSRKIKRLREILAMYKQRNVNAMIVQGGTVRDKESLKLVMNAGIPVIGDHTHLDEIDDVWLDVRAGAQMAVNHLIEQFGGPVAFVSGSDEALTETGRFKGYRDALFSKSMKLDFRYIKSTTPNYRGGFQAVYQLLQEEKSVPRSIFLYNLVMAMGANSALTTHGCRIPHDVAVAGCDDSIDVEDMIVPTTTVAFSYDEEASQILMLVEKKLKNIKSKPISIRISPKLIIRSSSQKMKRTK